MNRFTSVEAMIITFNFLNLTCLEGFVYRIFRVPPKVSEQSPHYSQIDCNFDPSFAAAREDLQYAAMCLKRDLVQSGVLTPRTASYWPCKPSTLSTSSSAALCHPRRNTVHSMATSMPNKVASRKMAAHPKGSDARSVEIRSGVSILPKRLMRSSLPAAENFQRLVKS